MGHAVSGAQFDRWVRDAQPGSAIEYHRGSLSRDCCDDKPEDPFAGALLRNTRRHVRTAYEAGQVTLTQKRHGEMDTSYIAIRRNANV